MGPKKPINNKKPGSSSKGQQSKAPAPPKPQLSDSTTALLQKTLDIFKHAYPDRFQPELQDQIQLVKKHLFEREFREAFGKPELLQAYCLRWSPSRALGYLRELQRLELESQIKECNEKGQRYKVLAIGGGAGAELVGFCAFLGILQEESKYNMDLSLVDIADWSQVSQNLFKSVTTAPTLSKYAAAHVVAANKPMLQEDEMLYSFYQHDVLELGADELKVFLDEVNLVTIFFTLNELYTLSVSKANTFLHHLRTIMPQHSQLVVIDSAGSYATVTLNGNEKKYPMQWLLDHTMLENGGKTGPSPNWTKLRSEDSVWFRLPDNVKYPIELEDMRYQIHVYKRE